MKKSGFTDSQIMSALRRVEAGLKVPDLCREVGISSATFYKWRAKYGGMDTFMMSRMKELEDENRRLTKMYLEEKRKAEEHHFSAFKYDRNIETGRNRKGRISTQGGPASSELG